MIKYPLLFEENLYEVVWGGKNLQMLKGIPSDGRTIGESWEISTVPGKESVVRNGALAGRTLGELVECYGSELLGEAVVEKYGLRFPLLVKFIDAARALSIQVHPDNALSMARHGTFGKTEMWYVMQALPGSSLLVGFSEEVSKTDCERRAKDGTIADVLARYEVHPGDVFFIPAGRIHSICGGIMVCEIQQSSDITYRLFDYNRPGLDGCPRELHLAEAREAIDYQVLPDYQTHYQPVREGEIRVVDCPSFAVNVLSTIGRLERKLRQHRSFVTLSCVEGNAVVRDELGHEVALSRGFSCLLPAGITDFTVASVDGSEIRLLESWAK